jgi:fibronectin-binding autotransporter adhesin
MFSLPGDYSRRSEVRKSTNRVLAAAVASAAAGIAGFNATYAQETFYGTPVSQTLWYWDHVAEGTDPFWIKANPAGTREFPNAIGDIADQSTTDGTNPSNFSTVRDIWITSPVTVGTLRVGNAGAGRVDIHATSGNALTLQVASGNALIERVHAGTARFHIWSPIVMNSNLTVNLNHGDTVFGSIGGPGTLTKQGAGVMVFAGANAHERNIVEQGIILLEGAGQLGSETSLTTFQTGSWMDIWSTRTVRGGIELEGARIRHGANSTVTLTGPLTLTASGSILETHGASTLNVQGDVSSTAAAGSLLTLEAAGTQRFTGAFNLPGVNITKQGNGVSIIATDTAVWGDTNILGSGSRLRIGDGGTAGTLGSNFTSVATGSSLQFNRSDTVVLGTGKEITGAGTFEQMGTGTIHITDWVDTATIRASNGVIQGASLADFAGFSQTPSVVVDINGAIALDSNISQALLERATPASQGAVALTGDSSTNLDFAGRSMRLGSAGNHTYSGTITPQQLEVSAGVFVPRYRLGGGGGTLTYAGPGISGAGVSLEVAGRGVVKLVNSNTHTGETLIRGLGVLEFSDAGQLGSGPIRFANGGTIRYAPGNTYDLSQRNIAGTSGSFGGGGLIGGAVDTNGNDVVWSNAFGMGGGGAGGFAKTGAGTLTLRGANTFMEHLWVQGGELTLDQSAWVRSWQWSSIGRNAGDVAVANLRDNAELSFRGDFQIGDTGNSRGTLNISGNAYLGTPTLWLGKFDSSEGTINQSGGTVAHGAEGWSPVQDWRIGGANAGAANAVGTYNMSGGVLNAIRNFQIGAWGTGHFNQTGGTVTSTGWTGLGRFPTGVGVWDMSSGSGTLTATGTAWFIVGEEGTGTLLVGGDSTVNVNGLLIGHQGVGVGTVTQSGGTVNAVGGANGTHFNGADGVYNLQGGVLNTSGVWKGGLAATAAVFNFNGGTLRASQGNGQFLQGLDEANVLAGGADIDTNGHVIDIAQSLVGPGVVTKLGPGTLVLSGGNAVGGLAVAEGTMRIAPGSPAQQVSSVSVTAPAELDLTNNRLAVAGGDVAAINALVTGGYAGGSWTGSGINSSTAAAESGRALGLGLEGSDVVVQFTWGGDATLDGSVTIADLGILAANWQQSGRYWYQGDFNYDGGVNIADLGILAANWQKGTNGGGMSFEEALAMFDVFNGVVVPEPASLGLLALGGLGLLGRRRRQ